MRPVLSANRISARTLAARLRSETTATFLSGTVRLCPRYLPQVSALLWPSSHCSARAPALARRTPHIRCPYLRPRLKRRNRPSNHRPPWFPVKADNSTALTVPALNASRCRVAIESTGPFQAIAFSTFTQSLRSTHRDRSTPKSLPTHMSWLGALSEDRVPHRRSATRVMYTPFRRPNTMPSQTQPPSIAATGASRSRPKARPAPFWDLNIARRQRSIYLKVYLARAFSGTTVTRRHRPHLFNAERGRFKGNSICPIGSPSAPAPSLTFLLSR